MTATPAATARPAHVQRDFARYERWAAHCTAGRCLYATLAPTEADPWHGPRIGEACPGYAGTLHLEAQQYVLRTRNCARKDAWWRRRQLVLREQHQKRRSGDHAPAKGWRTERPTEED
jgi:hypothetical protein